jgi:acetyl-CoA C-acetyltransferase
MREAVIISTARTPIGIAFKGALNNIKSPTMMGHAIQHAVERAGVDPGMFEDVVIGSVLTAGTAGLNVARLSALASGLPNTVVELINLTMWRLFPCALFCHPLVLQPT